MKRLFRKRTSKSIRRNQRRRLVAEPLEPRRVLAASFGWDGPGLGGAELTYTISDSPSSLSQVEVETAIEMALDAWSDVVDVTFTQVEQTGLADSIDISFTNIDGSGGTLAQAYFPDDVNPARIAGDIEFDAAEVWEIGNSLGNQAFDLVRIAAHEIGHSLGLDHLTDIGSVLQAYVSPNQEFTALDDSDIAEALMLYAPATVNDTDDGSVDDSPVDETGGNDTSADETGGDDTGGDDTGEDDTGEDETDNVDPSNNDDTDTPDFDLPDDDNPFSRRRWRRGGNWYRRGGRLEADVPENHNLYSPTDANDDGSTTALDALVIINQLSRSNELTSGFSDVNGDGNVTALDALMVINALAQSETEGISELVVAAEASDSLEQVVENDDESVTTEDDSELTNSTPTVGSDDDTDVVTDDELDSESDEGLEESDQETEQSEGETEETDERTVDDTESVDDETDASDETDETVDDDTPVDDGGLTDEDSGDDEDPGLCDHDPITSFGHHNNFDPQRPFRVGFDQLLARYDADEDGSLSEDEMPEVVWNRLLEINVDADGDGLITPDEFDLFTEIQQEERFASKDSNEDGALSEDEVRRFWQKIVTADTNSDGGVSLEEFVDWLEDRETTDSTTSTIPTASPQRAHRSGNDRSTFYDRVFAQLGRRGGRGR
ncbi:matrixin family metalloprotease [Novipirellula caenicola]|uniref:EF-hand domain-containing protein n=1 Tax=Novipirellula caenicola TaxID=1536901 RepID=A0ABP9VV15_9BACT